MPTLGKKRQQRVRVATKVVADSAKERLITARLPKQFTMSDAALAAEIEKANARRILHDLVERGLLDIVDVKERRTNVYSWTI